MVSLLNSDKIKIYRRVGEAISPMNTYIFIFVSKSNEKNQTNNDFNPLTRFPCSQSLMMGFVGNNKSMEYCQTFNILFFSMIVINNK